MVFFLSRLRNTCISSCIFIIFFFLVKRFFIFSYLKYIFSLYNYTTMSFDDKKGLQIALEQAQKGMFSILRIMIYFMQEQYLTFLIVKVTLKEVFQ